LSFLYISVNTEILKIVKILWLGLDC